MASISHAGGRHTDFTPGSIKKIKLRNFMVHSFIELDCSSRINLILGANGSGKSSIVCAICLGLGGDPGNMNRDGKLESYVKTGKNMAEIEITVMGPPGKGDYRITRVIRPKKEGDPTGVTHWWINGVKVKQEEIRDLMNELHIQMDNPCQFLPQELVSDFTSLDPVKLLRKTELAIDTTLHDRHTQLIRDGKQHEEGTSLLTRLQTNLENVRAEKAGLEGDVAAFAEMEKMKCRGEALKVFLTKLDALDLIAAAEKMEKAEHDDLKSAAATLDSIPHLKETAENAREKAELRNQELAEAVTKKKNAVAALQKKMEVVDRTATVEELSNALSDIVSGTENFEKARLSHEAKLKAAKAEAGASPAIDEAELKREADKLAKARKKFDDADEDATAAREALRSRGEHLRALDAQLAQARSVSNERLDVLARMTGRPEQNAMRVKGWVDAQTRNAVFKMKVYGPLILDIACDKALAGQVETVLPLHLKYGFVCQCEEDASVLSNSPEVGGRNGASFYLVRPADVEEEIQKSQHPAVDLQAVGAKHKVRLRWVSDVLECDRVVLAAILREGGVHNYIMTPDREATTKCTSDDIPERCILVGPDRLVRYMYSNYTHERYESRSGIYPSRLLHINVDKEQIVTLTAEREKAAKEADFHKQRQTEAMQTRAVLDAECAAAMKKMQALKNQRSKFITAHAMLKTAQQSLVQLNEAAKSDNFKDKQAKDLLKKIRDIQTARLEAVCQLGPLSKAVAAAAAFEACAAANKKRADADSAKARKALNDARDHCASVEDKNADRKKQVAFDKARGASMLKDYEETKSAMTSKDTNYKEEFTRLDKLTGKLTKVEVKAQMAEAQASIDSMPIDAGAKRRYDKLVKDEANKDAELQAETKRLSAARTEYDTSLTRFRTDIQKHAVQLSSRLGRFLGRVRCRGEVVFKCDEPDIAKWGLSVRVAFREGSELQQLSKAVQSGGECALSTMLVLLAMQDTTPLPFRVVDEINQGMDAKNEKAVMEILAHLFDGDAAAAAGKEAGAGAGAGAGAAASSSSSSSASSSVSGGRLASAKGKQLFIITPKLLPDMPHTRSLRSLVLNNGPEVKHEAEVQAHYGNFCALARSFDFQPRAGTLDGQLQLGGAGAGDGTVFGGIPKKARAAAGKTALNAANDDGDDSDVEVQRDVAVGEKRKSGRLAAIVTAAEPATAKKARRGIMDDSEDDE